MNPPRSSDRIIVMTGGDSALSVHGWRVAAVGAVVLLLTVLAGLAAAGALPFTGERRATVDSRSDTRAVGPDAAQAVTDARGTVSAVSVGGGTIPAEWDGPAVNLDWQGREYARAELGFVGDRIAVPGDRVQRTLGVVNAGPGTAGMTVTLGLRQDIPDAARNADLGSDVILFWEVNGIAGRGTFAELARSTRIELGQSALGRGEAAHIMLGFEMPREVESSRALGVLSTTLELIDVTVDMRGDAPARLPVTGGVLPWLALAIGGLLLLLGSMLLLAMWRRRRVCRECDNTIHPSQPRIEIRERGRARSVLCVDCASVVFGP